MNLNRLRVCQEVSSNLSTLKGRTGLTPNILCRLGFVLSIADSTAVDPDSYPPDSDREINRHTLTGEWDSLFVAMTKARCIQDKIAINDDELARQFSAHINRGVILLYKHVRSLNDLVYLMPTEVYEEVWNGAAEPSDE